MRRAFSLVAEAGAGAAAVLHHASLPVAASAEAEAVAADLEAGVTEADIAAVATVEVEAVSASRDRNDLLPSSPYLL